MTADEVDVETGGEGEVALEETETVEEEEEVMSLTGIGQPFEKFQCSNAHHSVVSSSNQ